MKMTRKDFLKSGSLLVAAGVTGPSLLAKMAAGASAAETDQAAAHPMEKRTLGRTGLDVTVITVGSIGTNENVVQYCMDEGINLIHTALDYDGGRAIREVGKAIHGKADSVYLALKVTWDWNSDREFEESLKLLGRDYVDITFFNIHDNPGLVASPAAKAAFERWKQQGKTRFMGLTTHGGMKACMESALKTGWYDCLMPAYKLDARDAFLPVFKECQEKKVGMVAMKTQVTEAKTDAIPVMLGDAAVTTICRSLTSLSEVKSYLEAAKRRVSAAEASRITQLAALMASGRCAMCGACTAACNRGVAVNDIVRSVDYYVDTMRDYNAGRQVYLQIERERCAEQCDNCASCETACPNHVPVMHYIRRSREMFC